MEKRMGFGGNREEAEGEDQQREQTGERATGVAESRDAVAGG